MSHLRAASAAFFILILAAGPARANLPPYAPAFIEPVPGAVVSAADPHFNLMPFDDPDPQDLALSSDFEVWDDLLNVRVWADLDETNSVSHVHVRDGVFEGPLAGESRFEQNRAYRIRARYRDGSGEPNDTGAWSAWVPFTTAPLVAQFPLKVDDVLDDPYLFWGVETGAPNDIPAGAVPSQLELRSEGQLLLRLTGSSSSSYLKDNPPSLSLEKPVALIFRAGTLQWNQAETRLRFHDQNGAPHTIYLPVLSIAPGDSLLLWVNEFGATYYGTFPAAEPEFQTLAREVPVPWFPAHGGVVVERVATGFHLPVNMAFLPDPGPDSLDALFYVTELYGKVKVVTRNHTVLPLLVDLLNFPPTGEFAGSGEMGVTGITYYGPERALYITFVYHEDETFFGRVIRAWLSADRKNVTSIDIVFEYIPVAYSHQVHMVTVGPDGYLYVNTGDGLVSQYAQLVGDLRGKVLRMTRDGGLPPDNPYPGSYTWARGFRNPVGAVWRPATNQLFICDNGAGDNDRIVKVKKGSNYGWCCSTASGAVKLFNPTVAPVALAFPPSGALPSEYDGRLFMTLSGPTYDDGPAGSRGKQIWSFALDDTGAVVQSELFLRYVGNGFATAVGLGASSDGLYFTDLYGENGFNEFGVTNASIYRVSTGSASEVPEPPKPPSFRLTAAPNPTRSSTHVSFEMPAAAYGELSVFDVQGRLVRKLAAREWNEGHAHVDWNGGDDQGRKVPSGIYFVRLAAGGRSATVRIVVSR